MKHFTWIGALALAVIAGAVYWTRQPPNLVGNPMAIEPQVAAGGSVSVSAPIRSAVAVENSDPIEPILVLAEWEIAPMPTLVDEVQEPTKVGSVYILGPGGWMRKASTTNPRPEAGRDPRPWMPYAPEDVELSATRRLEWAKLLTQEPALTPEASFEETAEPPLLETPKR